MAIVVVALVISLGSLVVAGWSLWYAHPAGERAERAERRAETADRRAERADRRGAARFADEQARGRVKRWSVHSELAISYESGTCRVTRPAESTSFGIA